ncbi:MAG: NUDIX hydrolase [Burkholderiaceae bacterium]|nr:NUDIX hydrolase [Burkholderiaceae bacterium]
MTRGAPAPDAGESPHLVETFVRGEQVFRGALLDVRRDVVALPDGSHATREYIVHPGAVVVVPILDDGRLVVERQFRYPVGRVVLEFPAGKLDAGEAPLQCGQRELMEETGYRAREWAVAGTLHNALAYCTEVIHIAFARGLSPGERALDAGELIELALLHEADLEAAAARGEVTDAKTLVGLLWLQKWRSGAWPLQWFTTP